jgi:peptide/nickel transport system substrate-binding protein
MKRLSIILFVLLAAVLVFTSCSQNALTTTTSTTTPTSTTVTPKAGGTLKMILIAGPQNAGGLPAEVFGPDATSYQFCMDSFLRGDNMGGVSPWLADSYKVADDMKSITFLLHQGVKFHDGTDFNATAAKWNLDNQITAKSSYSTYWDSVDTIDDYTIRVNLKMWNNTVLGTFADGPGTWMVSPTSFEQNGHDWMRDNPVGTGPFKFVSFQRDVSYKVIKNTNYWKKEPYLDGIEIQYIADPMTEKAAMQAGEADMLQLEPSQMAKDLASLGLDVNFQIITTYCFLPDSAHPNSPYANQKVREAVEYALDRESMATAFSYGYWQAPYQIPPPSNAAYNPNFSLARKYNVDKAKQLLAETEYKDGFTTTILVNPAIVNRDIGVALQNNLAAIGITAELSFPANMGAFIADSNSLENVLVIQPVMSSANFNNTFMFFMGMDFMWNHNFYPSPDFLAARNASVNAPAIDINLIRAATDQLSKEAAAIPFMLAGMGWAKQSYIMGGGFFTRGSSDLFNAADVWLNK